MCREGIEETIGSVTKKEDCVIDFEQTFTNFLLHHQERHNRTYHFLILMDALISAAKHIQHYYLTGALKGISAGPGRSTCRARRSCGWTRSPTRSSSII